MASPPSTPARNWCHPAVLLATCGGIGRIRPAPGTWGAAVGLFAAVLTTWLTTSAKLPWPAEIGVWLVINLASVPVCTLAARHLGGLKDPSAVVLDEAAAMPLVLLVVPASGRTWLVFVLAFGLFRLFDITKPPPCRQLERLPEGLGIMADDWTAAGMAAGVLAGTVFWL
jgi:phosphatidylglycerophosphatase A